MSAYDRQAQRKKPIAHMKGGLDTRILESAHIPIAGEQKEYVVSGHGLGIEFRRCYEFDYIDKYKHRPVADTCTKRRVVNVPQRTLNCYSSTENLLRQMKKGKKGRPSINHKILALVACSKSGISPTRVSEPMSPAIVAAVIGASQYEVRRTMEALIEEGKLATDQPLDVLNEKQVRLPQKYQRTFDSFIRSEKRERIQAGIRAVFGKGFFPASVAPDLPEGEASKYSGMLMMKAPKKASEKEMDRFMRETEAWKIRTGIVKSGMHVKRPSKIKKAPKKTSTY